jgi:hypothetical protein
MDYSSTVTKGIYTLHRRILSLLLSITSLHRCPGVATVGTTPPWKTSSDTSRKKPYDNTNPFLLRRLN